MKKLNLSSFSRVTFVVLLFTLFGFQQVANAQLTVINTTNCWLLVGEQEGPNCQFCHSPVGTWVPPVWMAPANQVVFTAFDFCSTPFPLNENWLGIKYGVTPFFNGPVNGSFTDNPNYPGGACGYQQLNDFCFGNLVIPNWTLVALSGASVVTF